MQMATLDWVVIAGYFLVTVTVGLSMARRAGRGTDDFFLAGRKLTWWLAGGSMVATMFASDTPLFHCGNVRDLGLSAGWLFFLPGFGALAAAAMFARMVRRTRVVTDAEFIELRYSGKTPAPFRAFMATYSGIFVASLTMCWVTKGMTEVLSQMVHLDTTTSVLIALGVVVVYSSAAGMWGVVMADMFQYVVAAGGSLFLAFVAVQHCGGLEGLRHGLAQIHGYPGADMHFLPNGKEAPFMLSAVRDSSGHIGSWIKNGIFMTWPLLLPWLVVNSIGQASATAHQGQRVLSCKTEKDASLTYVFFSICYYALNGLSWIVVGLASVLILGQTNLAAHIDNSQRAFPAMISALMPIGLRGLMLASIGAAFMSCTSGLLNWGSSYMVNDLYRRFMVKDASQKHYVAIGRAASVMIAIFGALLSLQFTTLADIFGLVPPLLTGACAVYLARYLWWRTNIWSEISAMVASPIIGGYIVFVMGANPDSLLRHLPLGGIWYDPNSWVFFGQKLMTAFVLTTLTWVIVTLLTPATDMAKLKSFYKLVRPSGPGWWYVRRQMPDAPPVESSLLQFGVWLMALMFVFGAITCVVELIRGYMVWCVVWGVLALVGAVLLNLASGSLTRTRLRTGKLRRQWRMRPSRPHRTRRENHA